MISIIIILHVGVIIVVAADADDSAAGDSTVADSNAVRLLPLRPMVPMLLLYGFRFGDKASKENFGTERFMTFCCCCR